MFNWKIYDTNHNLLGEPGGSFTFRGKNRTRIIELQGITREGRISAPQVEELGNYYLMFYLTRPAP